MTEINKGGRPPKTRIKLILRGIMKNLKLADVNLVVKTFTQITDMPTNYHTIKKYLDQLVEEDYLRVQVVHDNKAKLDEGKRQRRWRVFLYKLN
ncbi:hypothetical protein BVY01_00995 [bacterium I07]|nr:hypothetical protein BVY01_00995 [bacterium I07]